MEKGIYNNFYNYLDEYFEKEHLAERAFEPSDLLIKRANAFQEFNLKGLPSNRYEDWKYTNLNRLLKDDFKINQIEPPYNLEFEKAPVLNACRVVLMNGRLIPELSDPLPEGVRVLDTRSTLADVSFVNRIGALAKDDQDPTLALNTAFFKDVTLLHIAARKLINVPIHIVHYYQAGSAPSFVPYRMLLDAGPLSEATVVESFISTGDQPLLISYVCEQEIAESAVLHTHLVNRLEENDHLLHYREVMQNANSIFNNVNVTLGDAALVRNDLNFRLNGSGTETNLWGSYVTSDRQHVDNHTLVDHRQPHCNSTELYKGIMLDRSHAVFNGKIFVRPDAQKTNAFQQNNNVLFSDQATVNSKPQLEIFADDVKCSHGSTVGQLNEEALFYLRTRGIGEERAKRILVEAFVSEVHSKITIPDLKEYILNLLKHKLQSDKLITV